MSIRDKLGFSAWYIFAFFETVYCFMISSIYHISDNKMSVKGFLIATTLALLMWLLFFMKNLYDYCVNNKRHFTLASFFTEGCASNSVEKNKAMYPSVEKILLKKNPTGIVFGRYAKCYVCKDIDEDGHVFVIGGSGSGKSSCLVIPTLLANPDTAVFAIDIKGELNKKTIKYDDVNKKVFDPNDRGTYGYDPFYRLTSESTNQDILETMQLISFSLISLPADIKDPFWKLSARGLLTGLLIYYFRRGIDNFIDIIDSIMARPIKSIVEEVILNCNSSDNEYKYIIQFADMADVTLSGIYTELANHITVFAADNDIRYALRDNNSAVSPLNLENGDSIFVSIREEKLTAYYDVLQLVINQMLAELEKRSEDSHRIVFIIDELPRILSAGKIEKLLDAARTLRSRNVTLYLVTQSVEALMCAFSENEVVDLISNCPYIVVLSATSTKTQQMIQNWCGKYMEKVISWSGGFLDKTEHISYEEKNIITPADLMYLQTSGEEILISPYGYYRLKKCPYYADKKLSSIAKNVEDNKYKII